MGFDQNLRHPDHDFDLEVVLTRTVGHWRVLGSILEQALTLARRNDFAGQAAESRVPVVRFITGMDRRQRV